MYRILIESMSAGNWILVSGVELLATKSGAIPRSHLDRQEDFDGSFSDLLRDQGCSGVNESQGSSKTVGGIEGTCQKLSTCRDPVEESGEHVILGTDELYLDCMLYDLQTTFGVDVKVSDPIVVICETVAELSSLPSFSASSNGKNRLTFLAEPLDIYVSCD